MIDMRTEQLLPLAAVAKRLAKTPATVRNWIRWGWLEGLRLGGQWYTSQEALERMAREEEPAHLPATAAELSEKLTASEEYLRSVGMM